MATQILKKDPDTIKTKNNICMKKALSIFTILILVIQVHDQQQRQHYSKFHFGHLCDFTE